MNICVDRIIRRMACSERKVNMYQLKDGFVYREIAGAHMVIPVGGNIANFNGIITLNETGAFLWQKLVGMIGPDQLVQALLDEYEVSRAQAETDVQDFLALLLEKQVLETV